MVCRFCLMCVLLLWSTAAFAQPLGTFRWQLQPFCNVLTLAVTQSGGVFRLEGTDNQCGSDKAASAVGTAFANPDGSIGLGVAIVAAPSGTPVHVEATIDLSTLNGTWHDSAGNAGSLVPSPGAGTGGNPRPATTLGLSGVSLGFGLSSSGSPGSVSLGINLNAVKSGLGLRENGSDSLGLGPSAMESAGPDAYSNSAFGVSALQRTTTGDANTAIGFLALGNTTTGNNNTAIGASALHANVDGFASTAVGYNALTNAKGFSNTALGYYAGAFHESGSFNLYVANAGEEVESNTARIGAVGIHTRTFVAGIRGVTTGIAAPVPVLIDSAGQLGTMSSSIRGKEDIADLGDVACGIQSLRPVSFRYREPFAGGAKPVQYGLIAEEVVDVLPELVVRDATGAPETVAYHVLPTLLVAEVQRLERERVALIEAMDRRERVQATQIEELAREMAALREATGVKR